MTAALGSPFDVSGAAHVPEFGVSRRLWARWPISGSPQQAVTLLRLEGITASAAHRAASLSEALGAFGAAEIVEDATSAAIWSSVRDVAPFAANGALGAWPVWRIVCPPASGGALGQALARDTGGDVIYDWGGGLIWAALPPSADARAGMLRSRVGAVGGHAMLVRASEVVRRNVDVFHPQEGGLASLSERVRHSFDPKNILNRGRLTRGLRDMKTEFSLAQLADPDIAEADKILRACVHCGFCTATCPTYVLLGDELDSPRGRIYLIKEMLEKDKPPTAEVVKHIDRCLSCLACMTTCPSGVNYMHLVDQARVRIEKQYTRPADRAGVARAAGVGAAAAKPVSRQHDFGAAGTAAGGLAAGLGAGQRRRLLYLDESRRCWRLRRAACRRPARPAEAYFRRSVRKRGRVALLQGCAQQVLAPRINRAAISLLTRHGIEVVLVKDEQCCGALTHHLGRDGDALARARANITAWLAEAGRGGLDAIVVTTSGCGTVIKDYGFMLREDRDFAGPAAKVSALAKDVSEYVDESGSACAAAAQRSRYRLSLGMFAAARTENHAASERIAFQEWIRGERCTRESFVLRLGGHVQHSPA